MASPALARNLEYPQPDRAWIECVVSNRRLSPSARHLAHVLALIATDGRARASLGQLSELSGLRDFGTLIKVRSELERSGHIRVERSGARRIDAVALIGVEA